MKDKERPRKWSRGAWRDITTTYSMWSETGSCTGEGEM